MTENVKPKVSLTQFASEVRREISKVTWPTRKETGLTTLMVIIMTLVASVFFLLVDQIIAWLVKLVLGIGG